MRFRASALSEIGQPFFDSSDDSWGGFVLGCSPRPGDCIDARFEVGRGHLWFSGMPRMLVTDEMRNRGKIAIGDRAHPLGQEGGDVALVARAERDSRREALG